MMPANSRRHQSQLMIDIKLRTENSQAFDYLSRLLYERRIRARTSPLRLQRNAAASTLAMAQQLLWYVT